MRSSPTADASGLGWPALHARPDRAALLLGTLLALAASGLALARAPAAIDPDLVRMIRCMAVIKGGFAVAALAGCWWRLGHPVSGWRRVAYAAGPPLMVGGAVALWSLQSLGLAAIGLHLGLFGVIAAALTDARFLDGLRSRSRRKTVSGA